MKVNLMEKKHENFLALWRPAIETIEPAPSLLLETQETEEKKYKEDIKRKGKSITYWLNRKITGRKPEGTIYFPDGKSYEIKNWKDILTEVAKWVLPKLQKRNKIPIRLRERTFIKPEGREEKNYEQIGDSAWVNTHYNAKDCLRYSIKLLEEAGLNPDDVILEIELI